MHILDLIRYMYSVINNALDFIDASPLPHYFISANAGVKVNIGQTFTPVLHLLEACGIVAQQGNMFTQ